MRRFALPTLAALALVAAAFGCTPKYPACSKDEDCNAEQKRGEFCVNQLCQKCRDSKDCPEGSSCNKGRCDAIPGWCKDDTTCGDGVCKEHHCVACEGDGQCGEGGKCRAGKCIRKGSCEKDDDCPEAEDCKAGRCVSVAPVKASQDAACKLQSIFFDFNESVLSTEATDAIDANAACIKKVGRKVTLNGHSDPRGTEEYNFALSERRGFSVRDRLQRLGLDPDKMSVVGRGELDANGTDEPSWARDRRVDFEWR